MKKRIVSWILTFSILLSTLPLGVLTALAQDQKILYGDADGNGKVELLDVNLMERYIAGEEGANTDIHLTEADVNADGALDDIDVQAVKDYLVGNLDTLTPTLCTLTFETDGGGEIEPITVGKGYGTHKEIPSPAKEGQIFTGWVDEQGNDFYPLAPVMEDMTLTAVYAPVSSTEQVLIDSFALTDQSPDLSFALTGTFASPDDVKANLQLTVKDGRDPVELVVAGSGDSWTVSAKDGFRPGGSYELALGDGLTFTDKDARYRTVMFTIHRAETDTLQYNPDIIYRQDTTSVTYYLDDGTKLDVLDAPLLSNDQGTEPITGYFECVPLTTFDPNVGDIVCFYEHTAPLDRDYTSTDYSDDATAYVKVTKVDTAVDEFYRSRYFFESLGDDDLDEVLLMPDTIPYQVQTLPTADGKVYFESYDHLAYAALGNTQAPDFRVGDLLVFYTEDFKDMTEDSSVAYALITKTLRTDVYYKLITEEEKDALAGEFYVETPVEITEEDLDIAAMEEQLMGQIEESGFADQAAAMLASNAMNMESVQSQILEMGFTEDEIRSLAAAPLATGGSNGRVVFKMEPPEIEPSILVNERYQGGVGIALDVRVIFSVSKTSGSTTNSLKVEVSAGFEEQVAFDLDVGIDMKWSGIKLLSKLEKVYCNVGVDVKSYSSISIGAKFYTVKDSQNDTWNALQQAISQGDTKALLRELNGLRAQKAMGGDESGSVSARIEEILGQLPTVNVNGQTYTIDEAESLLGLVDVSGEFEEILTAQDESGKKTGLEQLMDKYSEMLNVETDWVTLVDQRLFQQEFHISVVAVKLSANLLVHTNLNLTIGADLEYEVGKRYNFWVEVISRTSGSSEMDLLDERFGFQFYMMGSMGVRVGVKLDVAMGFLTTSIGSIGANVEFGPYIKLHGYFMYVFTKERPQNSAQWITDEKAMGALHMEFGLYLIVKFKAQILFGAFKYEPTLYDAEYPLLTAGVQNHVYDFALSPQQDELCYIIDEDADSENGITMALPEAYRRMKTMDLVSGSKVQSVYDDSNFYLRFTNPCFSMGEDNKISVDPPKGSRRETSDMIVTWKLDKLAFSAYDISITVPVVWTSLSEEEMNKVSTATVMVGNEQDGFETVWSGQFTRLQTFDLPSQEEILDLIGYDTFTSADGSNLKYEGVGGYRDEKTTGLTIIGDTNYIYDIQLKDYTLTVDNVQGTDGSTSSRTYTAAYGKSFVELSALSNTGANHPETGKYSSFNALTYTNSDGEETIFSLDTPVNLSYINQFGSNGRVTAVYRDEARTATFTFRGVSVPDLTVSFRAGDAPVPGNLEAYVKENTGESVLISSVTPFIAPSESSMTYIVTCESGADLPVRTVHYQIHSPEGVTTYGIGDSYYFAGSVIFEPKLYTATGHVLSPWYYDQEHTQLVDFSTARISDQDITLYAEILTQKVTVHFIVQGQELSTKEVSAFGLLQNTPTVPLSGNQKFLGWYDNAEFTGNAYTWTSTIATFDSDFYLYANIGEKASVEGLDAAYFQQFKYTTDYDGYRHVFSFELGQEYLDQGIKSSDFTIQWRPNGAETSVEWQDQYVTNAPVTAGLYDIKLSWPGNDDYLPIDEIYLEGAIRINKIPFPTTDGKALAAPRVEYVVGGIGIWTPNNFNRLSYNGDNVVTYVLDYLATDGSFITYARESEPLQGYTSDYSLHTFEIADLSKLENISIDALGYAYFRGRMEVAEGTNYLGVTTSYGTLNVPMVSNYRAEVPVSLPAQQTSAGTGTANLALTSATASSLTAVPCVSLSAGQAPANSGMSLSAADIETLRGQEFELTLNLEGNEGIWGAWAQVSFDSNAFTLLGYSAGDVFTPGTYTTQSDLTQDTFRFLATRDTLDDSTDDGTLITLRFQVKDDAEEKAYTIHSEMLQAVHAQGEPLSGSNEDTLVLVNTHNPEPVTGQAPTCLDNGTKSYYRCTVCAKAFEDEACTTEITNLDEWVVLPATGHDYQASFDWAEDGSTCTVTLTCANDPSHTQTEDADVTSETKTDATCTDMGVTLYTATMEFNGQTYTDTMEVTDIPATGHDYQASFDWAEDGSACTVTLTCANDPSHTQTEDADVTSETKTDATCTDMGVTLYTATVEFEGQTYTDTMEVTDIPATGHDYQASFDWAEDGSACTVTLTCVNDPSHTQTKDADVTSETKTDATCTDMGVTLYTATVEFEGQTYTDTMEVTDITATGHSWGEPVFQWTEDGKTCTVTFTCTNDPSHTQTEDADVTSETKTNATCTDMGVTLYTATVEFEGQSYTDTMEVTDITAIGHSWGEPVFQWAEDGKTCTVTFTCTNDSSHTQTVDADVTSETKTAATCTDMGVTLYTAAVEFEGQSYTDTMEVTDIPATGHDYQAAFAWAEDGSACTVTLTCANDSSHTQTMDATVTSETKTDATCTDMGVTLYSATVEFEGQSYTDTMEVTDLPAIGHDWDAPTYAWSEDGKTCTATRICKRDDSHVETAEATVTGEQTTAPNCTENGETTYTAIFAESWATQQSTTIADIDATGHTYGEAWNSDAANHWHECTCGARADVAAHEFVWVVTKEAQVGVAGQKHEVCSVCGYEKAPVEIPALDDLGDGNTPPTGDGSNLLLWVALLFLLGGALGTLSIKKLRNHKDAM